MSAFSQAGKAKREAALEKMREEKQQKRKIRRRLFKKPPPCPSRDEQDAMIRSLENCTTQQLVEKLKDEEYRHLLNSVFNYWRLRQQIRVLRKQRGWTQAQLGQRAHMKQSEIARLENVYLPYDVRVSTLQRLAHAFDVVLVVRFDNWGSLIKDILTTVGQPLEALKVDGFAEWLKSLPIANNV